MSEPVGWMSAEAEDGFTLPVSLSYLILYRDSAGVPSGRRELTVDIGGSGTVHIILYNLATAPGMDLELYRQNAAMEYRLAGTVQDKHAGIFVDTGEEPTGRPPDCDEDVQVHYESHVRWSEPFRPEWIKADSLAAFRLGDGDQITGLASLYGNLLIFKQGSIHRAAVQSSIPFSRVDEISPDIGCIAPHSLITVRNTAYFLSHEGWISYDNNVLRPVDAPFRHMLMRRLRSAPEAARRAAAYHNPATAEIGLCLPVTQEYQRGHDLPVRGHVFVLSLESGAAWTKDYSAGPGDTRAPEEHRRIYHTTENGEVFSAETSPPAGFPALVSTEADAVGGMDETVNILDVTESVEVRSHVRLHDFLGGDASQIKRLRKIIASFYAAGSRTLALTTAGPGIADDRYVPSAAVRTEFVFPSAPDSGRTVLHLTPQSIASPDPLVAVDASAAKFHRLIVEVEAIGMAELFSLEILWRPVETWLE